MTKKKKILAVASAGGHWTQLQLMSSSFTEFDIHYVTTELNHKHQGKSESLTKVVDADRTTKFKIIILFVQMCIILIRQRPDTIISTGAAPGFFAIILGRLLGSRTIWVDSMANYQKISGSGLKVRRFCHLFLTQWPHLEDSSIKYSGSLI